MDKAMVEIENLKGKINTINEKLKTNSEKINNIKLENKAKIDSIEELENEISILSEDKLYSKKLSKKIVFRVISIIIYTILTILSSILLLSSLTALNVFEPFILLSITSLFAICDCAQIYDYKILKSAKSNLKLSDLDNQIKLKEEKIEENEKWLDSNEYTNEKLIGELKERNASLEDDKKVKEARLNTLTDLRNSIIYDFLNGNKKINKVYQKSMKK